MQHVSWGIVVFLEFNVLLLKIVICVYFIDFILLCNLTKKSETKVLHFSQLPICFYLFNQRYNDDTYLLFNAFLRYIHTNTETKYDTISVHIVYFPPEHTHTQQYCVSSIWQFKYPLQLYCRRPDLWPGGRVWMVTHPTLLASLSIDLFHKIRRHLSK